MTYWETYEQWLASPVLSAEEREELLAVSGDEEEKESRFYANLAFGTAGLRGVMGMGTNRMNVYVIRRTTQAFAQVILDAALRENVKLVGLSALMTTTVSSMEETIKLLREKKPDTKIVVGGAVLTQEYADQIGADAYARDAMEAVRYADQVFGIQ